MGGPNTTALGKNDGQSVARSRVAVGRCQRLGRRPARGFWGGPSGLLGGGLLMRNHPDHVLSLVDDPASSSTKEPTYTPGDPDPHAQQSLDGKDGNRKIQIADINWRCFDHARKRLEDDIRRYIDQYRKREEEYRTLDRRVNKIITQVGNGDEKRNVQSIFPSKQPKYCYAKSAVCIIATKGECWHSRCHGLPIYGEISPFPPDSSTFRSLRTGKDPRPFQLQGPRCHDLPIFSSSPQGYNATELPKNEAPTQSYSDISTSYGFTHTFSDGKFQEFKPPGKRKTIYVWQCCQDGEGNINIREDACPTCFHSRCAFCQTTKIQVR